MAGNRNDGMGTQLCLITFYKLFRNNGYGTMTTYYDSQVTERGQIVISRFSNSCKFLS